MKQKNNRITESYIFCSSDYDIITEHDFKGYLQINVKF